MQSSTTPDTVRAGCLSHLRVLDLSRVFAGPWATQIMADLGAEIIKVEHPEGGDEVRQMGFHRVDAEGKETGETSSFLAMNRGKRSVAIDFRDPRGRDLVVELARRCDVLVENFKSGSLQRRGLGYHDLKAVNPDLVYCSITGFGQTGPYRDLPGYDALFQAMSGLMSITGVPDGEPGAGPNLVGYSVSDISAGFYATIAVLAALAHRERGGCGQHIDLSLFDTQLASLSHIGMNYLVTGNMPVRSGSASQINCPWQSFRCRDMDLMIAVGNDGQFGRLCEVLGLPELADDVRFRRNRDRFANRHELVKLLADRFRLRDAGRWREALNAANVPNGPINDLGQALDDPQSRHRETLIDMPHPQTGSIRLFANPVKFSETPVTYQRPPPGLGNDTEDVLREVLGLEGKHVQELARVGIIGLGPTDRSA